MLKMLYKIIKRAFDILFSLTLLLLLLPLFLLISFLIWVFDRGEVFVKAPLRIGQNGKEFRMLKFRTMIPNAHGLLLKNPQYRELKKKWQKNGNKLKIDDDMRITKIGRILRKTDIDELPQLFNVLFGEMSLIGPRPTYKNEIESYLRNNPKDVKYWKIVNTIKPGITGIWQVSGRNSIGMHRRLVIDSNYVKNLNLLTDLRILVKTPYIVITRRGAYE